MTAPSEAIDQSWRMQQCLKCLQTLQRTNPIQDEFKSEFKRLVVCLSNYLAGITSARDQPRARLCLSQLVKTLQLLGSYSLTRQTLWYLSERLEWCLCELSRSLVTNSTEPSDSFVHLMDVVYDLLDSEEGPSSGTWRQAVHDLVCQAVTIAKVALPTDCKEINITCQQLLLESGREATDSFQVDLLSHILNTLEQRVNTAVLQLLLEVFSEPNKPLKQLIGLCGKAPCPRNISDLSELVAKLDAHVERFMLVGQYTVACCESNIYKVKVKCCLASLESVDNYLVPAVTAFYLDPDSVDKRALVKLLCDHWQEQLSCLHTHIDLIVDSQAFTKVTEQSMKELKEQLSAEDTFQEIGLALINRGLLLQKHLSCTPDSPIDRKHLKLFKEALIQCQFVLKEQNNVKAATLKVDKILSLVEYFTGYLDEYYCRSLSESSVNGSVSGENRLKQQNAFKLKCGKSSRLLNSTSVLESNRTIQDFNTKSNRTSDLTKINITEPKTPTTRESIVDLLTPYMNRVAERSTTLYSRTPRRYVQSQMMEDSLSLGTPECPSLALEVTEILENLSKLAETLSSEQDGSIISEPNSASTNPTVSSQCSGTATSNDHLPSLDSLDITLSQRLQDIQHLDDKIRLLKL